MESLYVHKTRLCQDLTIYRVIILNSSMEKNDKNIVNLIISLYVYILHVFDGDPGKNRSSVPLACRKEQLNRAVVFDMRL